MANSIDHRDKGRLRLTVLSSVASRAGIRFIMFDAASSSEDKSRNKGSHTPASGFQLLDEQHAILLLMTYNMLGLSWLGQLYLKAYMKKITFNIPNDRTEKAWMMFWSQMTAAARRGRKCSFLGTALTAGWLENHILLCFGPTNSVAIYQGIRLCSAGF